MSGEKTGNNVYATLCKQHNVTNVVMGCKLGNSRAKSRKIVTCCAVENHLLFKVQVRVNDNTLI